MTLGTTTWRGRNRDRLNITRDVAGYLGLKKPVIIDYGPGGAINFMIDWLPRGNKPDWDIWDKLQRGVVKLTESALRRADLFCLKTSEPEEVAYIFQDLSPERIYIVDKEKKVIDAVKRMVCDRNFSIPITYHILDILVDPFKEQGDIVLAYNIVERTSDSVRSLDYIARTTRVGGLLSTTVPTVPSGFEKVSAGLYRRVC